MLYLSRKSVESCYLYSVLYIVYLLIADLVDDVMATNDAQVSIQNGGMTATVTLFHLTVKATKGIVADIQCTLY